MRAGPAKGDIRMVGAARPRPPGRPGPRVLLGLGLVMAAALAATLFVHAGDAGIDLRTIDDPQPSSTTTTTAPAAMSTDGADVVLADPLDGLVPGLTDTLVMTVQTDGALELWTWGGGPDGSLTRESVTGELSDARPDPAGTRVAALETDVARGGSPTRGGPNSWLVVTNGSDVVPVFFGVRSYAWHSSDSGRIAWLSQGSPQETPTLYVGVRNDGGLYFQPVTTLSGFSTISDTRPPDRIVAFDASGFVIESWRLEDGTPTPSVERLDPAGRTVSSVAGTFVGLSPAGGLVVNGSGTTVVTVTGTTPLLPTASTSAVWSPDGRRVATTPEGSTKVTITDRDGSVSFDAHLDHLTVLAWSGDGRFVIMSGSGDSGGALAFVDTREGSLREVVIGATPIAAVAVP